MKRMLMGLLPLAVLLVGNAAEARDLGAPPSTQDIIDALKPPPQQPRLRGIAIEPPKPPPSIDMRVNFEFNSAQLTADAQETLERLGEALNSPELAESRFLVAGHTDAVGGDTFNLSLSERRAEAVKSYLATRRGVEASRIDTAGFGEARLLDPAHPDASVNRRVQITNIGK